MEIGYYSLETNYQPLMHYIEYLKLAYRAYRYKTKKDVGGIAFVNAKVSTGQTVMDIGAHKGGYLYFLRKKVGKSGAVHAFEPQSRLFQYLSKLKKIFHWDNVEIQHLALSDQSGSTTLYIPKNKRSKESSPGATILGTKSEDEIAWKETVNTQSLDAYCEAYQIQPTFLKIDVEGNELRVFQGGEAILKKYKPTIIVEIEARHVGKERVIETLEYLQSLGYKGFLLKDTELLPIAEFSFDLHQNLNDLANYHNNFVFE